MEEKNYYEILEVSKNASAEIIKTAYKSLIKKYHPDNIGNTDDNKKIIEIREAYEVLSDPKRKKAYDELIKAKNDKEPYSTKYQRVSNTQKIYHKSEKKEQFLELLYFAF